jgi:beta-N-acetylhexosaminidase
MFPKFLRAGKAGDIHLAIRKDGEIIGATLAALSPSPMHDSMAWADMLGSWCGAVGCVGVSARSRGEGAGVGMVAAAIQDLERRGADGVFIDWVGMKGFYERFGPTKWEAAYWGSTRKVTSE